MKKIYIIMLSIAAMMLSVDSYAQISVGAGYNNVTTTYRSGGEHESESCNGFYIEGTCDLTFLQKGWGNLALQPGVRFYYAGESDKEDIGGIISKNSFRETYFDIPVMVKYSYDLPDFSVYGFAGPVFAFGLTSTNKITIKGEGVDSMWKYYNYTGKTVTKGNMGDAEYGEGEGAVYAAFDTKFGIGAGVTIMEKVNIKLGYNLGLLNRYKGGLDVSQHTGVFYVGLGYNF